MSRLVAISELQPKIGFPELFNYKLSIRGFCIRFYYTLLTLFNII